MYHPQIIEKESAEVEARSEVVRKDEAVANAKAAEAQALKDECESELAEAIPALEAALAALNTLKVSNEYYFYSSKSILNGHLSKLAPHGYLQVARTPFFCIVLSSPALM